MLVEMAMTEDAEFASPTGIYSFSPVVRYTGAPPPIPSNGPQWVAQGSTEVVKDKEQSVPNQKPQPLSGANVSRDGDTSSSSYCIGESIRSLRQLLKRHMPWWSVKEGGPIPAQMTMVFRPYALYLPSPSVSSTGQIPNQLDLINYFGNCFAYFQGSIRIKAYPVQPTTPGVTIRAKYDRDDTNGGIYFTKSYSAIGEYSTAVTSPAVAPQAQNSTLEVQLPYYSPLHSSINQNTTGGYGTYDTVNAPPNALSVRFSADDEPLKYIFSRSIGDDFSYGFWLSTPWCIATPNSFDDTNNVGNMVAW